MTAVLEKIRNCVIPFGEDLSLINEYTALRPRGTKYTFLGLFLSLDAKTRKSKYSRRGVSQKDGDLAMVEFLINAKADVNKCPYQIPHHRVATSILNKAWDNCPDVVPLLIANGAIPSFHDFGLALQHQMHIPLLTRPDVDIGRAFADPVFKISFARTDEKNKALIRQCWCDQLMPHLLVILPRDPCGIVVSYVVL